MCVCVWLRPVDSKFSVLFSIPKDIKPWHQVPVLSPDCVLWAVCVLPHLVLTTTDELVGSRSFGIVVVPC